MDEKKITKTEQESLKRYEIERRESMEKREFGQILTAFEGEDDCPIVDFIEELVTNELSEEFKKNLEYLEKITDGNEGGVHLEDVLNDYRVSISDTAFEIGFVYREMFQISENQKSVKRAIERIKVRISEKGLLPAFVLATEKPPLTPAHTVITSKDCRLCRFGSMCSGAALFETIPTLQSMSFDDGCPRDWDSLKDLVEVSILPNTPAP